MPFTAHAASAEKPAPSLARQPILAKDEKVVGYEVLFRDTSDSPQSPPDRDPANCSILQTLKNIGLEVACDGHLAFIPCTGEMLLQDAFLVLPPNNVVVEISTDITISSAVMEACQGLRKRGYKIAIDNFRKDDDRQQLVPFADFLKVDFAGRDHSQVAALPPGKLPKMLAQNVDSRPQFKSAEKAGFTLFQGYFFRNPEHMQVRQIPASQTSKLQLLQAISAPEIDFDLLEDLIRRDASLCYRLMRYLNSPVLGLAVEVHSVRQAVTLLGEQALIRWIRTATALSLGQPKCSDLVLASMVRARFCELIAPRVEHGSADLFLIGMFSLMDAILETPMEVLLRGLAFDPHAKAVLLAMKNGGGTRLSPICDLMVAREKGDWERVTTCAAKLTLPLRFVNRAYIEAMEWAYEMTKTASLHKAR